MDDLTLLGAKAALLRHATEKQALSADRVNQVMQSAAARGVSDQRVQQLLGKFTDWLGGTLGKSRALRGGGPLPAWLRDMPREKLEWGTRTDAITRAYRQPDALTEFAALNRLMSRLNRPLTTARTRPAPAGPPTYGEAGPGRALGRIYGHDDLPPIDAAQSAATGWAGRRHPATVPPPPVAPPPAPPAGPPPSRLRRLLAAGGPDLGGAGALTGSFALGRTLGGPEPAPAAPPRPAPTLRQSNAAIVKDNVQSGLGSWWSRMKQRYGEAA